jgi:hypothetical protein
MDIPAMFGGAVAEFDSRVRQFGEPAAWNTCR